MHNLVSTVIDQHNADQFTLLRNQVLMGLRGLTEHIIGVIFGYTAPKVTVWMCHCVVKQHSVGTMKTKTRNMSSDSD